MTYLSNYKSSLTREIIIRWWFWLLSSSDFLASTSSLLYHQLWRSSMAWPTFCPTSLFTESSINNPARYTNATCSQEDILPALAHSKKDVLPSAALLTRRKSNSPLNTSASAKIQRPFSPTPNSKMVKSASSATCVTAAWPLSPPPTETSTSVV